MLAANDVLLKINDTRTSKNPIDSCQSNIKLTETCLKQQLGDISSLPTANNPATLLKT